MDKKIKVLFVAGRGRSGSTIIDNIMGQLEGFFSAGEIRFIRRGGLIQNRRCGCWTPFLECHLWREVLATAFPGKDKKEISSLLKNYPRKFHLPLFLIQGKKVLVQLIFKKFIKGYENLYQAIQKTTGCNVIVDSSKFPQYGYMLGMMPSIELYVLHLVRDSRAVARSWVRHQPNPNVISGGKTLMARENVVQSSFLWNLWNLTTELYWKKAVGHYMLLRYEDFVTEPRRSVQLILELLDEPRDTLPFSGERHVELKANHTIAGNPVRLKSGLVEIRQNEEWKEKMSPFQKGLVTFITRPLLRRYGYLDVQEP